MYGVTGEKEKRGPFSFCLFDVMPVTSAYENVTISKKTLFDSLPWYLLLHNCSIVGQSATVIGSFLLSLYSQVT